MTEKGIPTVAIAAEGITQEAERQRVVSVLNERRRRARRRLITVNLARLGVLVAIFGAWQLAVNAGWIDEFFWSSPAQIWNALKDEIRKGDLPINIWYTFSASVLGFVIGTVIGTAFGMGMWWSEFAARVFDPFMVALNAMPKIALAPLLTVSLGLGVSAKVVMAVLLVSVVAAIAAREGTKNVDLDQETLLRSLGASRAQIFRKLVFPTTLPSITSAFRINIGLALIGVVVAEFIGGQYGLGIIAVQGSAVYDVAKVWVAVFALGILALFMYWGVELLERVLLKRFMHH